MNKLYTPCYLCDDVVPEGSRRFDALEPRRTSARAPCTPYFHCKDVVSVQSNQPELMWKNSTHLAISAMMWFEKVRAPVKMLLEKGSVQSNHPELMWKNSTNLAISVMMWFQKVRGGSMHPELVHEHPAHLVSPVKM